MSKLFIHIFILLLFPSLCLAAPSVTGVSGTTVLTINGSGFGTGPTIYKWDDFEGPTHTVGVKIGDGPPGQIAWYILNDTEPTSYVNPYVRNDTNKTNSTKYVSQRIGHYLVDGKGVSVFEWKSGGLTPTLFVSMWAHIHWVNGKASCENLKMWRFSGTGGWEVAGEPTYAYVTNYPIDGINFWTKNSNGDPALSHTYWGSEFTPDEKPVDDEWRRLTLYGSSGTEDTADGFTVYDRQLEADGLFYPDGETGVVLHTESNTWGSVAFEGFVDVGSGDTEEQRDQIGVYLNYDDIYIADSRARVEIGNASTWTTCTRREIQPSTAWADGSITVTTNQGSFPTLEGKYIYVIDSTGAVNTNGYPYTGNPNSYQAETVTFGYSATGATMRKP